ncbi:MAG: alpha/beta hydrolase [Anaerolineae bacterium]|nr:alpha/beta hydrolase [Anaerolineae bacterium]
MTTINLNDNTFEYVERGSGEPLVLVHGSASDYRTWQAQQDAFARRFRTIRYSRRYHWPSAEIPEGADYSMAEHVDDLEALLRSLDAAPAHLVGHSYGAFLCLLLAIRAPELVRSLVLAEPPAITLFVSNQPKPAEILRLLLTRPRTALAILRFGAQGVAPATAAIERGDAETALRAFGSAILGREAFAGLAEVRLDQARANFIEAELLGSGFAPLEDDELRGIQIPALLVSAQKSPRLFHRLMDRLEELLPHTERVEIAGASHIMHEDNPAAYNEAVLSFLAKHRQVAPQPVRQRALAAGLKPDRG